MGRHLLLVLALAAPAPADIKVTPVVTAGQVAATFSAPDAFTEDTRELVRSGVPVTFTYLVELRRPSSLWLDRTVGSATVAAKVKFDSLTTQFQVTKELDGHVTWSKSTAREQEMRTWVTTFDSIPIRPEGPLEPNAEYYVRVRLDAHPRLKFSFWPFWPFWPFGRTDGTGQADFTFIR